MTPPPLSPSPPLHSAAHHIIRSICSLPRRACSSPPLSYVAGVWADIETCHALFEPDGTPRTVKKSQFPRSQSFSPRSRQPPDGVWDVVIVGAGCIGACVARELSKSHLYVLLLDSADDVTQGATKGNSGIVHAGYDDKPGTNRAKYCWKGNQMFAAMDNDLHFGFQKNGSLVIALNEKEEQELENLVQRGAKNGVKNLRILSREEVCVPECLCSCMQSHITFLFSGLRYGTRDQSLDSCRALQSRRWQHYPVHRTPSKKSFPHVFLVLIRCFCQGTSSQLPLLRMLWIMACLCAFVVK